MTLRELYESTPEADRDLPLATFHVGYSSASEVGEAKIQEAILGEVCGPLGLRAISQSPKRYLLVR